MPEIAEVETVRNTLKKRILNKEIKEVKVLYNKMLDNSEEDFVKVLTNNKIKDIKRVGKWLIFELNDHYLLSHLRMEGKYFLKNSDELYEKADKALYCAKTKGKNRFEFASVPKLK